MKAIPLECVQMLRWDLELAQRLKGLRGHVSRKELASRACESGYSCSPQYIQKLEDGRSESVSIELIQVFCEVLDIQIEDLLPLMSVEISSNFTILSNKYYF